MNLQIVRPTETCSTPVLSERLADALLVPAGDSPPAKVAGTKLFVSVDAVAPASDAACLDAKGQASTLHDPATLSTSVGTRPIACPNDKAEEHALDERAKAAARFDVDGVVLDAPDAWYVAGLRGAGFGGPCQARLNTALQLDYGEQFTPSNVLLSNLAAAANGDAPFWRERDALRLRVGVEHGARLMRRIRDEARTSRNLETQVGVRLLGLGPAAIELAQRADFALVPAPAPMPERSRVTLYEIFRAAMAQRAVIGMLDADAAKNPALVAQAARLAGASGAEVTIPHSAPAESHAALAAHRKFWKEFRSRYRPSDRLAEVLLLYSPQCDHWSGGAHAGAVRAIGEALTRLGAQYRVVLSVPRSGTEPVVLADAFALPEEDAARLEKRITEGASAIVFGRCGAVDDEGRPLEGPLPELSGGLNKVGAGTVFLLEAAVPEAEERRWEPLVAVLDKAMESLLGRGRRAVSVSKPTVVAKAYLDPERKLDVHLVGRAFDPVKGRPEEVKGLVLHLAGASVSGARTGYLFTADQPERKVPLTPFGMGVQAVIPDFVGSAVLSVAR